MAHGIMPPPFRSGSAALVCVGLALALAFVGGAAVALLMGAGAGADAAPALARSRPVKTAYAHVSFSKNADGEYFDRAKGVVDVEVVDVSAEGTDPIRRYYCFDLAFVPKVAVGSVYVNNNGTVGTAVDTHVPGSCPPNYRDAAARTYAANTSEVREDIGFSIVFH